MSDDLARIRAFQRDFARAQAITVVEFPGGFTVLDHEFPFSYEHNRLVVTGPVPAAVVLAEADRALGGAGRGHRQITVADEVIDPVLVLAAVAAGYQHGAEVVMRYAGGAPPVPVVPVGPADLADLAGAVGRGWREAYPDHDESVVRQLTDRRVRRLRGAEHVEFLAVRDEGEVRAYADLYAGAGVAQIEDLMTEPSHVRRGYARALVAEGVRRGLAAGCDLVFIVAEADDWPREWYARLGFEEIARSHTLTRA